MATLPSQLVQSPPNKKPTVRWSGNKAVSEPTYRVNDTGLRALGFTEATHKGRQSAEAERAIAHDYFANPAARSGLGSASLTQSTQYEMVRLSLDYWLLITLYRNHWICRKIVDGAAQDMVKAWPRLSSDIAPKELTKIDRAIRNTLTKRSIMKALKWARLFGGAGALIVVDGHEKILDKPLDIDDVEIGSFRGLIPFDRWTGIQPSGKMCYDIRRPRHFNTPEAYTIQSQSVDSFNVHASRILRFEGPGVPTPEYEAQSYWGISVLEPVYEELIKRDNLSWNFINASFRANILSIEEPELAQMLSGLSGNQKQLGAFWQRIQAMNNLLSNQSLMVLGKDGKMGSVQNSMSGYADLYQQFQLDIAGAAEYPVARLFGRTVSGLGQTNDADERVYEDKIRLEQEYYLGPNLDILYPVICKSELGEVPDDLDMIWPSIRVLSEEEKGGVGNAIGETIVSYYGAGIYKQSMAMKDIKQTSDLTGIGTNITDEDIAEVEELERMGLAPAMPGESEGETGGEEEKGAEGKEEAGKAGSSKPDLKGAFAKGFGKGGATDAKSQPQNIPLKFAGFDLTVEYPADTIRQIWNDAGELVYSRLLDHDYGFINGTVGRDGDEIDMILGDSEDAPNIFVIDMHDLGPDVEQRQDEDKVCIGFENEQEAILAFHSMYPPQFLRGLTAIPVAEYRKSLGIRGKA